MGADANAQGPVCPLCQGSGWYEVEVEAWTDAGDDGQGFYAPELVVLRCRHCHPQEEAA
jgi:hypothetical protein